MIDIDLLRWGLEELGDKSEQEKPWLGNAEGEMSSFEEAVSNILDDLGLGKALESMTDFENFSPNFIQLVGELNNAIDRVGTRGKTTRELIDSTAMVKITDTESGLFEYINTTGKITLGP